MKFVSRSWLEDKSCFSMQRDCMSENVLQVWFHVFMQRWVEIYHIGSCCSVGDNLQTFRRKSLKTITKAQMHLKLNESPLTTVGHKLMFGSGSTVWRPPGIWNPFRTPGVKSGLRSWSSSIKDAIKRPARGPGKPHSSRHHTSIVRWLLALARLAKIPRVNKAKG